MLLIIILIIGLILRIWNLDQSFWLDEAAQAIISSQNISVILNGIPAEFHPPFFGLLAHFWLLIGIQEWFLRTLPLLFGMAGILSIYYLGKELFSQKTGLIAATLLAINPFAIYFSQEFRPYISTGLLSILTSLFLWKALKSSPKWWYLFGITTGIFFYTSYLAEFLLIGQFTAVILDNNFRPKIKQFLVSSLAAGLLFIPWLIKIPSQIQVGQQWILDAPNWQNAVSSPILKILPLTFLKFIIGQINFRPLWIYGLIGIIVCSIWLAVIYFGKCWKNQSGRFLTVILITSLIISVIFSLWLPILAPKRLIFLLPIILLMLAFGLTKFSKRAFTVLMTWMVISSLGFLIIYQTSHEFLREDWRDAVKLVESKSTTQSLVLFKFSAPFAPYIWYQKDNVNQVALLDSMKLNREVVEHRLSENLPGKRQLFLFQYLEGITDPSRVIDRKIIEYGFIKSESFNFPGVGLIYEYQKLP